jgi:hypothetical protein
VKLYYITRKNDHEFMKGFTAGVGLWLLYHAYNNEKSHHLQMVASRLTKTLLLLV